MSQRQIFQTESSTRWTSFKWVSRTLFLALALVVICVIITVLSKQYPQLPNLSSVPVYSKKDLQEIKRSSSFKEFKLTKEGLITLTKDREKHSHRHPSVKNRINAGFFVAWDPQSYNSLSDHIDKMDMILPEFFFLSPGTDSLTTTIDKPVLNLVKKHRKLLVPTLKNYSNQAGWDGQGVHHLLSSPQRRARLINNLLQQLQKYHLDGINVDFEELTETSDEPLIQFQKELYQALHPKGLLVTQDIIPDNSDYNVKALAPYNDYLFLMAYDQHSELSNAGAISDQHWVEKHLDKICSEVPSEKVILAIAGYGFDWPLNRVGTSVTYQQAISTARINNSKVNFDPESGNLNYSYMGPEQLVHHVYFTDAATNFNMIRLADDWGTGGVALWRLGSEDPRLWQFYNRDLSIDSLQKNKLNPELLTHIELNNRVDYAGDGEILDLVSEPVQGKLSLQIDPKTQMITGQQYLRLPTKYTIRRFGQADKKVILTFDDGPDAEYTPQILKILKQEKVPATFFVVGIMAEQNIPLLREIYDRGYEIGNHTFFHPDLSKVSQERVIFELNATRKLIESVTGRSTILFRAPFNADAEPQTMAEVLPVAQSRSQNYINVGESIDPQDWQPGVSADSIVARVIAQQDKGSIILLHDAGGDRSATVQALPRIIDYYKKKGYQFTTVASILGKQKAEIMPIVTDAANTGLTSKAMLLFIESWFYGNKILYYVFITAIILALARLFMVALLAISKYQQEGKKRASKQSRPMPPVSIIIPAYNEEITAVKTIKSLLKLDYPCFELIFVDDGSKDQTYNRVSQAFEGNNLVRVFSKPNGGKASALNYGIRYAQYPFVVCIDADTQLHPKAVSELMVCFETEDVGAVAGTVKVGNETNLLTKWQSIEYITSQNMDRRAFDTLNSITVVPGAIGAFSKQAISQAGGFTSDTLAEDCDLTMRILKAGYIVKNCSTAIAYTEAPETMHMFLKQRFRWSFGVIQSFWKNRDALFNKKYAYFGMVGMPNILIFQILLPLFAPLADLFMLIAVISGVSGLLSADAINWATIQATFASSTSLGQVVIYYWMFIIVDILFAMLAFKMEGEPYRKLVYILPQRFIWRQLMYYVLFKSIRKAIKGEMSEWGALKRTGNVKEMVLK